MIKDIHEHLYRSNLVHRLSSLLDRLPLPYSRMIVNVLGNRMTGHTMDRFIALWLWKLHILENEVAPHLPSLCSRSMKALDIGANIGFYSLLFSEYAGPSGHVWAFEPDRRNVETLERNLSLNACCNVTVEPCAVGAKTEPGELFLSESHQGDHRTFSAGDGRSHVPIEMNALDDIFSHGEVFDLVKIDVQGAEQFVLEGMRDVMSRSPNMSIILEIAEDQVIAPGCSSSETIDMVEAQGFRFGYFDRDRDDIVPVRNGDALLRESKGRLYLNLVATKRTDFDWLAAG